MEAAIVFVKDKETKGAIRFAETGSRGLINTLYVRKHAFEGKIPENLTVTLKW
jgi:hypothetical protein